MYYNCLSLLLLGGLLLSYYLIHSFPQLLLETGVNLWKSVINVFLNAHINIPLFFIRVFNVLFKGKDYSDLNVLRGRYLSEHYITISLILSTPR